MPPCGAVVGQCYECGNTQAPRPHSSAYSGLSRGDLLEWSQQLLFIRPIQAARLLSRSVASLSAPQRAESLTPLREAAARHCRPASTAARWFQPGTTPPGMSEAPSPPQCEGYDYASGTVPC